MSNKYYSIVLAASGRSKKANEIFKEVEELNLGLSFKETVGIALQIYTQRASKGRFEFQLDDGPGLDVNQIKRIKQRTLENNYKVYKKWVNADSSQVEIFLLKFQLIRERVKNRALTKRIDYLVHTLLRVRSELYETENGE